ncbi:MAG: hypothetical protein FGM46_03745 [Ferruginibacter sp.]|nr:hypothetical protein [Ferruginibacter sp.]
MKPQHQRLYTQEKQNEFLSRMEEMIKYLSKDNEALKKRPNGKDINSNTTDLSNEIENKKSKDDNTKK